MASIHKQVSDRAFVDKYAGMRYNAKDKVLMN